MSTSEKLPDEWVVVVHDKATDLPIGYWRNEDGTVPIFTSKADARAAVRAALGRMPNTHKAIQLDDEDRAADLPSIDEPEEPEVYEGELLPAPLPDPAEGIDLETADLDMLAKVINAGHEKVLGHARGLVVYAWHTGRALNTARGRFAHGEWLPWLAENFDGSQQTAQRYMTLATNYSCVSNLDPALSITGALKAIEPKADRKPREKKEKDPSGPDFASSEWMAEGAWALVIGADGRRFIRTVDGMFDLAAGNVALTPELAAEVSAALTAVLDAISADKS